MSERSDIDALIIGGLYDELDTADQARLASHLQVNPQARHDLDALRRTRAVLRELSDREAPELEPPPALSAMLMHEAAKHARSPRAVVAQAPTKGFLAWLGGLFQSLALHPAAAAVATLVLIGGIAGALYLRKEVVVASHDVRSAAPAPAAMDTSIADAEDPRAGEGHAATAIAATTSAFAMDADTSGYAVDLAEPQEKREAGDRVRPPAAPQEIASATAAPGRGAPSRRQAGERAGSDLWSETNAISGTDPLVADGDFQDGADATNGLAQGVSSGSAAGPTATPKGGAAGIAVQLAEPGLKPAAPESGTANAKDGKADAQLADKETSATETIVVAPSDADGTLAWAKAEHVRLRSAFKAKKCPEVARIANDVLDRAPDYYLSTLAASKDVKGCQAYVKQEARKRGELRAKSRTATPDLEDPMSSE